MMRECADCGVHIPAKHKYYITQGGGDIICEECICEVESDNHTNNVEILFRMED